MKEKGVSLKNDNRKEMLKQIKIFENILYRQKLSHYQRFRQFNHSVKKANSSIPRNEKTYIPLH